MPELAEWDSFYLMVGSAAGALIGLQFVVMTLFASRPTQPGPEVGAAFATPTIVHFAIAFFLAAIIRAPWKTIAPPAYFWGLIGITGLAYSVIVIRHMRAQNAYQPVFEDWLFHCLLPLAAYAALAISTFAAFAYTRQALFAVGGAVLLLLLIGIHNSWDAVTYHIFASSGSSAEPAEAGGSPADNDEPSQGNASP